MTDDRVITGGDFHAVPKPEYEVVQMTGTEIIRRPAGSGGSSMGGAIVWTNATLANDWQNTENTEYYRVQYAKDGNRVIWRGHALPGNNSFAGANNSNPILIVPKAIAPSHRIEIPRTGLSILEENLSFNLVISKDGDNAVLWVEGAGVEALTQVSLDDFAYAIP